MSNSKNHQSMINLFFLLAISHSQVSAISFGMIANQIVAAMTCSTEAKSSQCCTVAKIWTMMKKNMTRATTATSCCQYLGQKVQRSGIPGVYCDSDGKVIQLFWQSQFLNGSIPPVIEKLEDLQLLSLGNNQLTGPIPASIGNLKDLTHLYVDNNQLAGPIPPEIGRMGDLRVLYINKNPGLKGTFAPNCNTVIIGKDNTGVTIDRDNCISS